MTPIKFYLIFGASCQTKRGREHLGIKLKKRLVSLFGSVCSKAKCRAAKKLTNIKMIGGRPRGRPLALYTQALYGVALVVTTAREAAELTLYAMDAL